MNKDEIQEDYEKAVFAFNDAHKEWVRCRDQADLTMKILVEAQHRLDLAHAATVEANKKRIAAGISLTPRTEQ